MRARLFWLAGALVAGIHSTAHAAEPAKAVILDPAEHWDKLWHTLLTDLTIIGTVFAVLAVIFILKFRTTDPNAVGSAPKLTSAQAWGWALIPAFLFMADDFFLSAKGWSLWNIQRQVPAGAMEVKVRGAMWAWSFEYENGISTTYMVDSKDGDGLVVPVGKPVVLRMTSDDVVHSFFLPKHRVKEDLMPGRITYLWFMPKEVGETFVTCTEYCGLRHSAMYAPVKVLSQADYDTWVKKMKKA
ncbi:MAG: hypothetical protein HQL56_06100 [Magnetococcales bacterium]|nr:hypothetical protein [Magnetococcales bacterium]